MFLFQIDGTIYAYDVFIKTTIYNLSRDIELIITYRVI